MVLDTVTRRARRTLSSVRGLSFSRLAWIILVANGLALIVLIVGMLAVSETRRGLVNAKIEALLVEGRLIANVMAEGAAESDPSPILLEGDARLLLRDLYVPDDVRARIFNKAAQLVADSHLLTNRLDVTELPPPGEALPSDLAEDARSLLSRLLDRFGGLFRTEEERAALNRTLEQEVAAAIEGEVVAGVRRQPDGSRVVSVTVPIQPVRAVVGVVTLESFDLDQIIADERRALFPFFLLAALVSILSSLTLTVFIARPIRRLAEAARRVRQAKGRRVEMPSLAGRRDEIGELGEALREMTAALYDRMDAIEQFAADVAHELKNPLTSIRSAAEILPRAKNDEQRDRLLQVISSDVRRMDRLITDISRASRLDAELAREAVGHVDLVQLIGDTVSSYETARESGPRLAFTTGLETGPVEGRAAPIGQVVRNLIDNAITFSPVDGVVSIRLSLEADQALTITVEDEGPGIPPDNLETIFKRFYTQRPKGAEFGSHSGLGLAIARQIVRVHGGHIRAENRVDENGQIKGARFVVAFPRAAQN
ncbi:stimulus-sensing domain-containing protein [Hyphobacterium sp. HN65]|uniref:histidine kinase n=1 Tax=Hyphobacterium lacteum TaxID=3116575 RepID=A0ABU7LSY4_9PROT|nr:stimulus-sensing domain-containing protein [Hyphobacterium sp. HN65]MEE2526980.1 stimulus-sensing domain-containing protein [Hyphobacterium sp. HN65]